jgi:hypothetical protein
MLLIEQTWEQAVNSVARVVFCWWNRRALEKEVNLAVNEKTLTRKFSGFWQEKVPYLEIPAEIPQAAS